MRVLFAGPSLSDKLEDIRNEDPDLVVMGPAVWGDVARAVSEGATVIGIVDGCFEQTRSVWHKEILYALSRNVVVAGAASMGALRAAECNAFGMIGIGEIYEGYACGDLVDDSDVALIHATAEFNYLPLSEPRINMLATFDAMHDACLLDDREWKSAIIAARRTHYAELTYPAILNNLPIPGPRRLQRLIAWVNRHRINLKQIDALRLVQWIREPIVENTTARTWEFSESAQWQTLVSELRAGNAA
jgi:hypothetical protein